MGGRSHRQMTTWLRLRKCERDHGGRYGRHDKYSHADPIFERTFASSCNVTIANIQVAVVKSGSGESSRLHSDGPVQMAEVQALHDQVRKAEARTALH